MTRVKRGITAHRRHRKMVKAAKGYRGQRHKLFTQAKNARMKAGVHSYKGRKLKKRTFRQLWITRINAASRPLGISYSKLIAGMVAKCIIIDRKMLSELAMKNLEAFKAIVEAVQGK